MEDGSVNRQEDVELKGSPTKQGAITEACQAHALNGGYLCPVSLFLSASGTHSSSSTRTGEEGFSAELECGNRLGAFDRGEVLKEQVQGVASLQPVKETLNGDAGADEDRACRSRISGSERTIGLGLVMAVRSSF